MSNLMNCETEVIFWMIEPMITLPFRDNNVQAQREFL